MLCMVCLLPLCSLVLFFAFHYVVRCVLFLPEEVRPMQRTKCGVKSFSLRNIIRLLLYLLKFDLLLIVPEELINFKLNASLLLFTISCFNTTLNNFSCTVRIDFSTILRIILQF